jgi:hypothetical protein
VDEQGVFKHPTQPSGFPSVLGGSADFFVDCFRFSGSVERKNVKMSDTNLKSFDAIVQKEDRFIFVEIPFLPREVWGAQPRYPVTGTINGFSVRGTLGVFRQNYFLRLGKTWMRDSKIEIGENVTVRLSFEFRKGQQPDGGDASR